MPKVTITALPRQGFRGFGAIERYFITGTPVEAEVSAEQFKELTSDPATFFLKVEDGFNSEKQPEKIDPPAEPPKAPKK